MTVKELIKKLQQHGPDAVVFLEGGDEDDAPGLYVRIDWDSEVLVWED